MCIYICNDLYKNYMFLAYIKRRNTKQFAKCYKLPTKNLPVQ